jgi:hypothetical protein
MAGNAMGEVGAVHKASAPFSPQRDLKESIVFWEITAPYRLFKNSGKLE